MTVGARQRGCAGIGVAIAVRFACEGARLDFSMSGKKRSPRLQSAVLR